jgi:CRISPR-associated protein (TIGR02584 family)
MPHRILLAVTGLSPQIVTETVYALAVAQTPPWVPDEVQLLTTARGADNARLKLLSDEPGWFARLCADWQLPPIAFDAARIHVVCRADGSELDDIRDDADNLAAADAIVELVRRLTREADVELHASIAGGRKTMGYYLGMAMSLYARECDRLSHVLVSPPFESHPEFYYPTPATRVIHALDRAQQALDTSRAQVWLGDIPLLRLRQGLPRALLDGRSGYAQTVAAAQRGLEPPSLVLDLARRVACCGGVDVTLPPGELAFLAWMARRAVQGLGPLPKPTLADHAAAEAYLAEYRHVVDFIDDTGLTAKRLAAGMDRAFFEERAARLKRKLGDALGEARAAAYSVTGSGARNKRCFALTLPPQRIRFEPLAGKADGCPDATAQACRAGAAPSSRVKLRGGGHR